MKRPDSLRRSLGRGAAALGAVLAAAALFAPRLAPAANASPSLASASAAPTSGHVISAAVLPTRPSRCIVYCVPPTFTSVGGSYNPSLAGAPWQVRAFECDRFANVYATGTITFTDLTTNVVIGTATLTSGSPFGNCSQAIVSDSEGLGQGNYTIQAVYSPGGSTPVPASAAVTYTEVIQ